MAISYTAVTSPTVTNLSSLADAAYWVSSVFDNTNIRAHTLEIFITLDTTTTAGTSGSIDVFIAGSVDGGTNFAGGITTESDATYSPVGDDMLHWKLLGSLNYTAETTARVMKKRFSMYDIPKHFKLVILNDTGTALGSGNTAIELNAIKF